MSEGTDTEIRQLDSATVERIAAGEVVERPASVVKELVENALDADADRVSVAVEQGGIEGIKVTDDGIGMSREAVERAVEEHTTSKISSIEDLENGVGTLGFRGEALHAIGAVSRTTITTRPRGGDRQGTELVVEGGDVTAVEPAGCPAGTTIEVDDLFYNVPARRKYLKQASTEFAHVNTVVTSYALANPDVAVTLSHDGRETFATTGQGDLEATVLSVYGREVAQSMIEVDDSDLPDGPLESVTGLVSHPETNRASRDYLSTYVNGRYVRADAVREAIVDAYDTQLAPDRYPFAVLFCAVDPATVDVNVHPRKMEVRFADDEGVRRQVEHAVQSALLSEGLVRSSAPRGRSAAEQTEITPESGRVDDETDAAGADEEAGEEQAGDDTAGETSRPDTSVSGRTADGASGASAGESGDRRQPDATRATGVTDDDGTGDSAADTASSRSRSSASSGRDEPSTSAQSSQTSGPTRTSDADRGRARSGRDTDPERKFRGDDRQARLGGEEPTQSLDSLPALRILGQLHETYVVAETDDGLVVIDQHAADERINYERLKDAFEGETTTQALAEPVELELTAGEAAVFEDRVEALARLGFHADRTGDRTVEVRTVPGVIADAAGPELVQDVLAAFVAGEHEAADTVEAAADELLADLACYPSITGNTSLTEGSIRELLAALDDCGNPYACPHGRPVVVEIDRGELEDRFERDYPGHSGRRT
ncbi:DNA mismatch repair endonuclease MutL [Halomicrobium sp. IBSBa]|uniref:DNA mismatch repair endonuclease MutL n=1 Tax=Halomicrobium sp. IBSBa TaxID=2778916 RepID=UPI001ABF5C9A|nr:DNA mismatch repair endonuclease MutL [Halomicrobium sp. IBSBa]MBO4247366.1 DNA mismatch repair endonuclease MutL [Halomicrobium sp. IBSBa]